MKVPVFLAACFIFTILVKPAYSADFSGLPVVKIDFKDDYGLPWSNPERLISLLTITVGSPFSKDRIRESIEYLYVTGLFKDIRAEAFPDPAGVRLEFSLVPITTVKRVRFNGNHAVSTSLLEDITSKLEGKEYREDRLQELRMDMLSLYHSYGYFDTKVNFRVEGMNIPHQVILLITIEESQPTLIQEITFVGDSVFSSEQLLRVMKSKKGKPLRRDLLLDTDVQSISRLYHNAGYLLSKPGVVDMAFYDNKVFITITGEEGPKVTVAFTGNSRFSSTKLKKNILIFSEHDATDSAIDSSQDKIKSLYREEGYADVNVEVKKITGPGTLEIIFMITEGHPLSVKKIMFEGNRVFSMRQLKRDMALQESGWLWFMRKPFREDVLDKDVDAITERYLHDGYLSVAVDKKITRLEDTNEVIVTFIINEGTRTTVGMISFEGNQAFTQAELLKFLVLKPGAPFNELVMDEDKFRILSAYSNKGYLYSKVEVEKRSDAHSETPGLADTTPPATEPVAQTVDIHFKITEDKPVTIGKIILRGNETTHDRTLTRELLVSSGGPYDYGAILKSQQRIYSLRYFGLVRFEPLRPGEKEYVKDMLLTVEERPAGSIEFGAGYGNLDRLRGFIEIAHRNLWGGAEYASARLEGSDILKRAIFNYQEPWLLSQRLLSKFTVTWFDRKEINSQTREIYYETREIAVAYGIEHVHRGFKFSLAYQFEDVDNFNVNPDAVLTSEDVGRTTISSINPGVLWDLRDDPFNPRRGSVHGIAIKEALTALGSQADFTKVTVQSTWFLPVNSRVVGALSGRAGMAWPHGETPQIPIHERFYAGGGNTIRGYAQDSVGPKGLDGKTPTGGDGMAVFNAEIRTNPGGGFGVVLFTDAGNVWTEQTIHLHDLRASYGAGIRYNTPVGPLRLDYGQKIHRLAGESPGELHLNIGHAF